MNRQFARRTALAAGSLLVASLIWVGSAVGCGPWLTFRAYLRRSFWQPVRHLSSRLATSAPRGGGTASYAGFRDDSAPLPLAELRRTYREIASSFIDDDYRRNLEAAQRAAAAALAPGALTGTAFEEARLLDAKVAMRAALDAETGDVAVARHKLEAFLAARPSAANASEARCWLARVLHRQGDSVAAARIYLAELDGPSPVVPAEALATSVRIVFVGHEDQFWEHAEVFFDNPRHALFIVNVLTNPTLDGQAPGAHDATARDSARMLALLRSQKALFTTGADSDALSMALMRVSLFSGDLDSVLRDSGKIAPTSPVRNEAEFNWLVASAQYLGGEYAKAEEPLRRMLAAPTATVSDRRTAAQALLAVYLKVNRRVDALHAALLAASLQPEVPFAPEETRPQWCVACDIQDLPYLLDAVLSTTELAGHLRKYSAPVGAPIDVMHGRKMSTPEIVEYSLAVRHAREGHYAEAAAIYAKLRVPARAERMRVMAAFAARAADKSLPAGQRLQARYDLAAYLADNPERILFNDLLWHGFQRQALTGSESLRRDERESGMTAAERQEVVADDRRLRDEQEERWQAYLRLQRVVHDAEGTPIARDAVLKILDALAAINTDRFGRQEEIAAAITKWRRWLRTARRQ